MEEFIPYEKENMERKLAITYTDSLCQRRGSNTSQRVQALFPAFPFV
jgi:hypothetical protein